MTDLARHWIDGACLESELVADSYNPATGELLGRFADGGEAEARAAVSAAHRAFAGTDWGRDRALRSRALLELAERFEARAPELALILTRENGKTLAEATGEVGAPAATLRHNGHAGGQQRKRGDERRVIESRQIAAAVAKTLT